MICLHTLILFDHTHPQLFSVWHHSLSADSSSSSSSSCCSLLLESPPLTQTRGAGSASYISQCSREGGDSLTVQVDPKNALSLLLWFTQCHSREENIKFSIAKINHLPSFWPCRLPYVPHSLTSTIYLFPAKIYFELCWWTNRNTTTQFIIPCYSVMKTFFFILISNGFYKWEKNEKK